MRVVVSAEGVDLDAAASPVFGRCPVFVFVDIETMACEGESNPSVSLGGGAGVQAAQFVLERGAQAVLSSNVGPNAFEVLQAAGVPVFRSGNGSVRQVVAAFAGGTLEQLGGASAPSHNGMRR